MTLTLQAADAVLKEDYKGPVAEQLNNANVMLAQVERNSEDIVGRRWVTPLHVGRNRGVGARAEMADLPRPGHQQYDSVFGAFRSMYARIELTGQSIEAMKKDRGSFIRALRPEMEGATTDAMRDYCRQIWGTSNGVIAAVASAAGAVVTLAPGTREDQLRHLEEGFLVDFGTLANPVAGGAEYEVVAVDYDALTVTLDRPATAAAGQFAFRAGGGGVSDQSGRPDDGQVELTGLQNMIDDTSVLHTLDPADEPRWKAAVVHNDGTPRSISEALVTKAIMQAEIRSGQTTNLIVGSDGVFRAYSNLLAGLKRFTDTVDLKGGYRGLSISAVKSGRDGAMTQALTWDRDAPSGRLYGLNTKDFVFYEMLDWDWMDNDGAVLNRVPNKDAFEATLKKYGEFACRRRNSQWVITDIAEM
jgi:hypothetical protein